MRKEISTNSSRANGRESAAAIIYILEALGFHDAVTQVRMVLAPYLCPGTLEKLNVCDLLEKPAFFANECELFCADSIRHIPKYLLINGFVVKVRIRDDTLLARAQRAPHAGTTLSPEHAEMLSQYLLRLATALKLAVIAHKDDRITRYTSPLKVVMIVVIMILIVVMMTVAIVVITRYTSPLKALALSNVCSDDSSSSNK